MYFCKTTCKVKKYLAADVDTYFISLCKDELLDGVALKP